MNAIIQRTDYIDSSLLRRSAKGQACVFCGARDGTVVACHYTGQRQHLYGKGKSIKGHDCLTADLCVRCHAYFDQPTNDKTKDERSEEFLHCIALTLVRRMQRGVLVVAKEAAWDSP